MPSNVFVAALSTGLQLCFYLPRNDYCQCWSPSQSPSLHPSIARKPSFLLNTCALYINAPSQHVDDKTPLSEIRCTSPATEAITVPEQGVIRTLDSRPSRIQKTTERFSVSPKSHKRGLGLACSESYATEDCLHAVLLAIPLARALLLDFSNFPRASARL